MSSLFDRPNASILKPGERHWEILAIEHGATLHTTDRDFARFPGLKWTNPLPSS